VNVTALLFGVDTAPTNLIYTWRVNGSVIGGSSVRGGFKSAFEMPLDPQATVSVDVTTLTGEVVARSSVSLLNVRPELHFYENHTLYGLQPLSLNGRFLRGQTATVIAAPYYLDSREYNDPDVIEWTLNGQDVSSGSSNPYEITINSGTNVGSSRIGFRVQSTTRFLQGVEDSIQVFY
jgi:hypothetical protein